LVVCASARPHTQGDTPTRAHAHAHFRTHGRTHRRMHPPTHPETRAPACTRACERAHMHSLALARSRAHLWMEARAPALHTNKQAARAVLRAGAHSRSACPRRPASPDDSLESRAQRLAARAGTPIGRSAMDGRGPLSRLSAALGGPSGAARPPAREANAARRPSAALP
jgi:hypothetical protein